ncbi:phage head closure protein [Leuconostoc carnosum]|uniref:phage head closure protein n=1 Tax=Leuconostoc carnosum TaxID=1252 RepID=UPI00123845E7|nr:phage head closure protein [Leuconostoc carnosum]KAA8327049.1 phage tail protein [Leuconostoc carnosum]
MLKYKPSDFNKKAQFGTIESGYNPKNGNPIKQFVPQIGLKYASRTRTMTQQYTIAGTTLEDTILIVIRHNKAVNKKLIVMLPDKTYYDIASISPDDSNNVITYDIVTLKLNTSIK